MGIGNTQSLADQAFASFSTLVDTKTLFTQGDRTLSEADTRAKLIDPLFKRVLGWSEAEIRREEPVKAGYVDYVLGSDYSHVLIEAKRAQPRFQLNAPGKPRRLKLSGPHLLGHRKIRDVIHQAQGYASDLGVQFCLIANGSQIIVFRPYLPGKTWKQGTAIVYHDHQDILDHFAEFFELLREGWPPLSSWSLSTQELSTFPASLKYRNSQIGFETYLRSGSGRALRRHLRLRESVIANETHQALQAQVPVPSCLHCPDRCEQSQ